MQVSALTWMMLLAGLLISQTTSAAHYALLALSFNVPTLFMSQIPTLGMHAMHAAQTAGILMHTPT